MKKSLKSCLHFFAVGFTVLNSHAARLSQLPGCIIYDENDKLPNIGIDVNHKSIREVFDVIQFLYEYQFFQSYKTIDWQDGKFTLYFLEDSYRLSIIPHIFLHQLSADLREQIIKTARNEGINPLDDYDIFQLSNIMDLIMMLRRSCLPIKKHNKLAMNFNLLMIECNLLTEKYSLINKK